MAEGRWFCENCGVRIGETTNFCPNCGAAQKPNPDVPSDPPSGERETRRVSTPTLGTLPPQPQRKKRSGFRTLIYALVIVVVLIILSRACAGTGGSGKATGPASDKAFTKENYAELATDPASFKGAVVDIEGRSLRNPEVRSNDTSFQMFADPDNSEWNTVVHTDSAPSGLASGDNVRIKGKVQGAFSGKNAFGASITAPEIQADSVEVTETEAERKAKQRPSP